MSQPAPAHLPQSEPMALGDWRVGDGSSGIGLMG
jgi:hypothetical protein